MAIVMVWFSDGRLVVCLSPDMLSRALRLASWAGLDVVGVSLRSLGDLVE